MVLDKLFKKHEKRGVYFWTHVYAAKHSIVLNCSFHHVQRNKKVGSWILSSTLSSCENTGADLHPHIFFNHIKKYRTLSNSEPQFVSFVWFLNSINTEKIVVDSCSSLGFSFSLQICTLARLLSSTTNTHSSDNTVQIVYPSHPLPRL